MTSPRCGSSRLSNWEYQLAHPPTVGNAVYCTAMNSAYTALEQLRPTWMDAMTRLTGGAECADGAQSAT